MLWSLCTHLVLVCIEIVDLSDSHLILSKKNILLHLLSQFIVVPFILLPLNSRGRICPFCESSWGNRSHTDYVSCFYRFCFCLAHSNHRQIKKKEKKGWPSLMYLITPIMKTWSHSLLPHVCNKLSLPLPNKLRQLLSLCPCSLPPPVLSGNRCPIWHICTHKQKRVRWWALVLDPWLSALLNH